MSYRTAWDTIRREWRTFGAAPALYDLCLRALNRAVFARVLDAVVLEEPCTEFLKAPAGFSLRITPASEMGVVPEAAITPDFLELARSKRDVCVCIYHRNVLASSGWYSFLPTEYEPGMQIRFDDTHYPYMYKGHTDERYRGKRLHAVGITHALQHFRDRGCRGLISAVESNNLPSLKSTLRMGFRIVGRVFVLQWKGRGFAYPSPGCRKYGFRVEKQEQTFFPEGSWHADGRAA